MIFNILTNFYTFLKKWGFQTLNVQEFDAMTPLDQMAYYYFKFLIPNFLVFFFNFSNVKNDLKVTKA